MSGSKTAGVHVELYVRSLAPRGVRPHQVAVIETLDSLVDQGSIDRYTVHVCGRHAPATLAETTTEFGVFLLNRVADFREWAERNGWSLGPLFETRTVDSSITGEQRDVLELPVMAMAEYHEDDLRFVAPCSTDEREWTVQNRLDALSARGDPDTTKRLPAGSADPPTQSVRSL